MQANVLQNIYNMGEEMLEALESDNLDRYHALLEERGTLLDTLDRYNHPSELVSDWKTLGAAVEQQSNHLNEAVTSQERRIAEALAVLERFKDANASYAQPHGRASILNDDLRV